jgi:regulator of replication initiation timing
MCLSVFRIDLTLSGCNSTPSKPKLENWLRKTKTCNSYRRRKYFGPCDPKTTGITVWAACVNKYIGEQQAKNQALKTQVDTQQQQMGELAAENKKQQAENKALKTQLEQLSQLHTLPATTENCTGEQTGQIRFDGTYARLCNGTHWQVIDARHPKQVLKRSAKKYTMAEVRATAGENEYGQGTICETGYHLCIFMEALVLKYAYPRSRIAFGREGFLRTLGNYSGANYVGNTQPHNSLLGYKSSGNWNGPSLQCPDGSGPMIYFSNRDSRNTGHEWNGGCHKDDKRHWACCINNLD